MTYNAADRKQVRAAEKAAAQSAANRREMLGQIMSAPPGREWIHDTLVFCHVFETTFDDSAARMGFLEGQRSVGLRLLADIMRYCPDAYILMMQEAGDRDARSATERSRSQDGNGGDQGPDGDEPELDYGGKYDRAAEEVRRHPD